MTDTAITTQPTDNTPKKRGRPPKSPQRLTEPAQDDAVTTTATPVSAKADTRHNVSDAVHALVDALGVDEKDVKAIDIRRGGVLRLYGTDNSLRGFRFEEFGR